MGVLNSQLATHIVGDECEINFYGSLRMEILSKWTVGLQYSLGGLSGRGVFELDFERYIDLTGIN